MASKTPAAPDQKPTAAFIVGIGASAGGLEALKTFFEHVPSDTGMAFVIVQHLDPTHKSLLAELLSGHTKMMGKEVAAGVKVTRNTVYVIPPNKGLVISKQKLRLNKLPEDRAIRRPIDTFLHSLAEDQKENAVGIVLSGTGTEGTLGLKEIKAAGVSRLFRTRRPRSLTGCREAPSQHA